MKSNKIKNPLRLKRVQNNKDELNDTGFSNRAVGRQRSINKDGSFNIARKGLPFRFSDTYTHLITMRWWKFNSLVFLAYLLVNLLFASVYYVIGMEHFGGVTELRPVDRFFDAFIFSAQTISTVGYGHIYPTGFAASSVAALESLLGLLGFALATGLLYGRFSRPVAKIVFSNNALIAPYRGINGLMFRIANKRTNQLIEVEVQVVVALNVQEDERLVRRFFELELERKKVNFFPLSWTIVHPIDEKSPIWGFTHEDLENAEAEFLVLIKAFDDTYSQNVHTRYSYTPEEVLWDKKFVNIIHQDAEGKTVLELDQIHDYAGVK